MVPVPLRSLATALPIGSGALEPAVATGCLCSMAEVTSNAATSAFLSNGGSGAMSPGLLRSLAAVFFFSGARCARHCKQGARSVVDFV